MKLQKRDGHQNQNSHVATEVQAPPIPPSLISFIPALSHLAKALSP